VRRHAKAPSAATTESQAGGLGRFVRGALATRASSSRVDGSGAPSSRLTIVAAATTLLVLSLLFAATAGAAQVRPFEEDFGSVAQPSFQAASTMAVDQSTGDLLVGDASALTIRRFKPDGTPDPFSALGTNVIDGKEGSGGKPCAEEPESCDKTPQNGLTLGKPSEAQIVVDNSGGPTDGNIYVTHKLSIDIFGSDGSYLGQLTTGDSETFGEACGVAVGPDGTVYVGDYGHHEIYKYVPSGAIPVNSDNTASFPFPGSPCTLAAGAGPSAGSIFPAAYGGAIYKMNASTGEVEYKVSSASTVTETVDPTTGHLFVVESGGGVVEYDVSGAEEAVVASKLASTESFRGIATDSSDRVYVSLVTLVKVFGPPVPLPSTTATAATGVTGVEATLNGSINPEGVAVEECFFEWGVTTAYGNVSPCEGAIPTDSADHPVKAEISGLSPDGTIYHFRLVAKNENGTERSADRTFATAATVVTEPATGVTTDGAMLHGTLRPEGEQYLDCIFEYGLTTTAGYEDSIPCEPAAGSIPNDFGAHPVSAEVTGLDGDATYKFRLVGTKASGTVSGAKLTFNTQGPPRIVLVRGRDADQSSATLEAQINPNGFGTSYVFEWGPTTSYGNSAPAGFESIGSGTSPVTVSAQISGLSAASTYHYRVVAKSAAGTTESADQTVETLNSCGLPEQRCFELVSPRDAGPVALPAEPAGNIEMHYQASPEPGKFAYVVETGFPDATKGAEVVYRSTRGDDQWHNKQVSPPILARNEGNSGSSASSELQLLSDDLSCGFATSNQPLTSDPGTRLAVEAGGANLYRENPDGSFTAVTSFPPENPEIGEGVPFMFNVLGVSQDCGKTIFTSGYRYPGVEVAAGFPLYEWDEGTLRGVGWVPGPSGEVAVEATAGAGNNFLNVVSADGSRVFFSASRQTSSNPEEINRTGVFVREDGTTTRDLSLSQTSVPDEGATYQYASKDGSRVFFTANAGLTAESSSEGTDLYEYDLDTDTLTDLTPSDEEGGAAVFGMIGGSDDGSRVYFIARGQLDPGKGKTFAENQSDKTYSVYGAAGGDVQYAGTIRESYPRITNQGYLTDEDQVSQQTTRDTNFQTSSVSPDGRFMAFESSADFTGYDSGNGVREAYLFDMDSGTTVCVSCRQDGEPSASPGANRRFTYETAVPTRMLTVRNGKPQVFFGSFDSLAPGAAEGRSNLYEWSHGQVFRIATEPQGLQPEESESALQENVKERGASADGTDVYFNTPQTLNWEDGDERMSIYSARIGGGYPQPPAPPAPCSATTEGSCQGSTNLAPAIPAPASSTFSGPGNQKPKKKHHKKKHHKRHHKKKKHRKHHKKQHHANANRRAGK
jgi:hypothetical protein